MADPKETPQMEAARYVGRQVRGARAGTLSSAQRKQRIDAARASAAKRKGRGTKDKNPQTPETKANERRRKARMAKPGTDEHKMALTAVGRAIESGEALKVKESEVKDVLAAARKRKLKVTRTKTGLVITTAGGKTLKIKTQSEKNGKV